MPGLRADNPSSPRLRRVKKMAGLLHRTAQPPTLAAFRPWEGSAGAGRVRPAGAKIRV